MPSKYHLLMMESYFSHWKMITLDVHLIFAFPGPDVCDFIQKFHWWIQFSRWLHYRKCKVIIAFEHPSTGFGFELEDSKIYLVTARWTENTWAFGREGKQKGRNHDLSDIPLNWRWSCQKGVNKLKTNRLLPLRPPHKDGQQILVSRFSKGWLKRLEGAQHKRGPRAVPEWGWTACQLGAPPCFHTQLQSSRIAEPGVHDLQIFIREEGVTAPRELEALRKKKKRKKILKVCWVSKEAHASCCSTE